MGQAWARTDPSLGSRRTITSRIIAFLFIFLCKEVCLNGVSACACNLSPWGIWFFGMHFFFCWVAHWGLQPLSCFLWSPKRGTRFLLKSCVVRGCLKDAWGEGIRFGSDWYEHCIDCSSFLANCLQESGAEKPPGRAAGHPATPTQLCHPPAFHHCEHQQEDCHRLQHF